MNDAIFYETWEDYLNSLLLHNYFFPATSYELIGFYKEAEKLYAAVRQPFIIATSTTDGDAVTELMASNGFTNTRNSDYINRSLGIMPRLA
ncbi:hypothetical protein SAMN05216436_1345 [bacterium A37T11]|nr:hypothetical protein SAMN05216436_1345 [bacterium A37T11]